MDKDYNCIEEIKNQVTIGTYTTNFIFEPDN
jgi:hypothetical protein